ncbi:MAG: hypothetical protein ABIP57_17030 [Jatrophihabitantaceae bacterium]
MTAVDAMDQVLTWAIVKVRPSGPVQVIQTDPVAVLSGPAGIATAVPCIELEVQLMTVPLVTSVKVSAPMEVPDQGTLAEAGPARQPGARPLRPNPAAPLWGRARGRARSSVLGARAAAAVAEVTQDEGT